MFGKHFASMYQGSMVGSGCHVFALMGYVIANMKPDEQVGAQVSLNPVLLATIFGEPLDRVTAAIDFLCAPDPHSTSPEEGGRRLVKVGQFDYRVVNGAKYLKIRNEEERREANRLRQQNWRKKKEKTDRERRYEEALQNGDTATADKIAAEGLPVTGLTPEGTIAAPQ